MNSSDDAVVALSIMQLTDITSPDEILLRSLQTHPAQFLEVVASGLDAEEKNKV